MGRRRSAGGIRGRGGGRLLVVVRGGVDVIVIREAVREAAADPAADQHLVGLRCVAAIVGYAMVLAMAALLGLRGPMVALAGLMLFPSAFVTDVGLAPPAGSAGSPARRRSARSATGALVVLGAGPRARRRVPARRRAWLRPRC